MRTCRELIQAKLDEIRGDVEFDMMTSKGIGLRYAEFQFEQVLAAFDAQEEEE